ncbi:MAG: hypothetical protein WA908_11320 [Pontixanthobacter sp.]
MKTFNNAKRKLQWAGLVSTAWLVSFAAPLPAHAQEMADGVQPTYADLVDYADPAQIVVKAQIRKQATVKPERAPGLAPGHARVYIEARTEALLSGDVPVGESLKYLVDVPLTAKGRVPKLKKRDVLLFGRAVPGQPGEVQLSGPSSQLLWSPDLEQRLRPILAALVAADTPAKVIGIRDALSIEGNLAGESETQIFLATRNNDPVSINIRRAPGQQPEWGVSWTEIVDQAARPPRPDTLEWYRLACFLPTTLPDDAILARDAASIERTREDYAFVRAALGECVRNR